MADFEAWYLSAIEAALKGDDSGFLLDHKTACSSAWCAAASAEVERLQALVAACNPLCDQCGKPAHVVDNWGQIVPKTHH